MDDSEVDAAIAAVAVSELIASRLADPQLLLQICQGLVDPRKRDALLSLSGCVNSRQIEKVANFIKLTLPGAREPGHAACRCDLRDACQVFTSGASASEEPDR